MILNNMKLDFKRGAINATSDILTNGLDRYFNDGIRFGFFSEKENPVEILDNIIETLVTYDLLDEAVELGLYKKKYIK